MAKTTETKLTQLGAASAIPDSPETATLECAGNPHPKTPYLIRFTCPEFTSLCPVTGQPDFAQMAADRRLLVSARRHPHRRVPPDGRAAQGPVDSGSGCRGISWARLGPPSKFQIH